MAPQIMESSEVLPSSNNGIVELDLRGCKMLNSLPNSTCELKRLEILCLHGCSNLEKLPPLYGLLSLRYLYLDGTALVEIPPDIVSLSSLELLSLSDTLMEELPSSIGCGTALVEIPPDIVSLSSLSDTPIEELPSSIGPYIDGIALVEIPPDTPSLSSLRRLSLKNCNRLQKSVSTSYIAPIKYREECGEYGYELNFCNSLNLDQNARGTIMADALRRIKELAIARCVGAFYPYFYVGLPEAKFPPGCFNNMFLGFVFCAIIEFKDPGFRVRDLHLICQSSFKNSNGYREASFASEYFCLENTIESDHVFFWYDRRDISYLDWLKQNCDMENEASFYVCPDVMDTNYMTKWEVKRFGFHLLCDKVELNKCNPYICREANFLEQFKETTNANNKRSREDFYSSNINGNREVETHLKIKAKFLYGRLLFKCSGWD
ncbi:hypothetical protein GH714_018979 [Hevea brasiliensis]|uniref:TIR domain-containing protein n=1 Tax=Hevea brasiliensis TaxID=3981 RepID=A0A6A6L9N8_HEVBR|nr:hypothetical protein GH714_018979 [Hevea brasiliensis]